MASYELPHCRFEKFKSGRPYKKRQMDMSSASNEREAGHGSRLRERFDLSIKAHAGRNGYFSNEISETPPALYLDVVIQAGAPPPDLNWKTQHIRLSALRVQEDGVTVGALYVPESSVSFFDQKLVEYAEQRTPGGKPKNDSKFSSLNHFSLGSIQSLWTDSRPFPAGTNNLWWECWCGSSQVNLIRRIAEKLNLRINENLLVFPDTEVLLIFANAVEISMLVDNSCGIQELRKASDSPYFFTRLAPREQQDWSNNLLERIRITGNDRPAVCILDNGVNSAHPLLQPALDPEDCQAINSDWGSDDHNGHGTNMAGAALFGDMTYALADQRDLELTYKLESVKFLPPSGWARNAPESYGIITQAAVSLAETKAPTRSRVFCMAVSNEHVSGERPTTWSSAIDQLCSGTMIGDFDDEDHSGPRRLFILSAGNIPDSTNPADVSDLYDYPIEDPAQSWNAIAIGGFTNKTDLDGQPGYEGWGAFSEAGDHSPYSRSSVDWEHSRCPIKPEVVFEAGNKALSPDGQQFYSGVPALSILTTARNFARNPIEEFWATSSATAQAAGMAAAIIAEHPDFWPETVRALMIHSAQWTPAMLQKLRGKSKRERILLARHFGYGVPQLARALASAEHDLALISEAHIQPFKKDLDSRGRESGEPHFNEVHYYDLPWPKDELERLENRVVQLKITLSYFIEPSPSELAQVIPARYQSFGLRFDLKRKSETEPAFRHRINKLESLEQKPPKTESDNNWTFGSKHISAGSVHSDVWVGPAIDLAARDKIAISPVSGWWRYRHHLGKYNSQARYSLIVSISSEGEDVRLYTEISNLIAASVEPNILV